MTTERRYDKNQDAAANARADVTGVQSELTDPDKALTRLRDEANPNVGLKGVDAPTQEAYRTEYTKQLQEAGVLPALSVAAVRQLGDAVKTDGALDPAKLVSRLQNERDPMQRALLGAFMERHDAIKREAPGGRITDDVLKANLDKTTTAARENAAVKEKQTKDKAELGDLLTKPELFEKIAGTDGKIDKADAQKFLDRITKGTSPEDQKLRDQFAKTPEEFDRLKKTAEALVRSFDNPNNDPAKKGSIMKDDSTFGGLFGRTDVITKDTLAKGMGYSDVNAAATDLKNNPGNPRPVAGIEPVQNYNDTKLAPGKGPQDLAARMLNPEQAKKAFGDDPAGQAAAARAREDLAYVMRKGGPFFKDQGKPEINAGNRDEVLKALREREQERAKATGQPVDTRGSDWFATRYPKLADTPAPAGPDLSQVKPDTNREKGRIASGEGPIKIAERMTAGEPLDAAAKQALRQAIRPGEYDDKAGPLTDRSIEAIRKRINEGNNEQLKAWYAKRYPPKA